MNKPVSVLNGLKQIISGNFLDAPLSDSPYVLPPGYMVVAQVPDELKELISRIHPLVERMCARQNRNLKSIFVDHKLDEDVLVNMESSNNEHNMTLILVGLVRIGIMCKVHEVRMYYGEPEIYKGWNICISEKTGFKLGDHMFLEPNHAGLKFFDTFSDIFKGRCVFDGKNGLEKYKQGEIVVGHVNDETLRQIIFLRKRALNLFQAVSAYTPDSELAVFKDKLVYEYATFKSKVAFLAQCVKLVNFTISSCMEEMIDPNLIPQELRAQDAIATEVREDWKIVVSE